MLDQKQRANIPNSLEIINKTVNKLGKRPCLLQSKICQALLRGNKNVICIAATGFGKTLTFLMPLLFSPDSIIIIVTALNILGKQNAEQLNAVGISSIAVNSENSGDPKLYKACCYDLYMYLFQILKKSIGCKRLQIPSNHCQSRDIDENQRRF